MKDQKVEMRIQLLNKKSLEKKSGSETRNRTKKTTKRITETVG